MESEIKNIIPNFYFEYLSSENFKSKVTIYEDEDDFQLYNLQDLEKEITIDGNKMKTIHQLKGFVSTILEINEGFFDENDKKEYKNLAECIAIGYENSRILFVNKDRVLGVFHPDGGDFEKVGKTLEVVSEIKKLK